MQRIFSPAIALLNRMGYTKKFSLLWMVSLIAVAVVAYGLFVSLERVIQPSQRELEGIALIKPISRTVQLIQQHRVFSSELLGGNRAMRERRAAREGEAVEAFKAMEGGLPASLASGEDFQHIKADWEQLRKDGLNWTMAENFAAHAGLIGQMLLFETFVADEYALTLDTEIDTFYLIDTAVNKLPHTLERLGQLRAYGTGILTRKQISESQKAKLNALMVELESTFKELKINLDKTGRYNPAMRQSLLELYGGIAGSAHKITDLVAADILTGHFATSPDAFLEMATMAIDKSYGQMHESLLPATEALIKARIARAKNELYTETGIALLAFLLVVYLSASIYYAIIGNIRSLVRSARTFAGGNLQERIKLDTRDELSWVSDSFNEMADGFNAMLEARKQAEKELADAAENLRIAAIAFETQMAIVITDPTPKILRVNKAFEEITGYAAEEVIGRNPSILSAEKEPVAFYEEMWRVLLGEGKWSGEVLDRRKNGETYPKWLTITAVSAPDGDITHYIGSFFDITDRKKAEQDIHQLAFYDPLTRLPNRRLLLDRLQQALAASARSGEYGAIMFLDLDNFKIINDTKGHECGDLLLVEAAKRLQSCVREGDTVARLGGDEFVVMLEGIKGEMERAAALANEVGEKILAVLDQPYLIKEYELHSTASIGINLFSGHGASADELLKYADISMYQAKAAGRNTLRFFDPEMQSVLEAHAAMEAGLHHALEASEFELYYQPKVSLRTGRVSGAEALLRWRHPERGLVSPAEFIPPLEESGLIVPVGAWVLRTACMQAKAWQITGVESCGVAVNLSAIQFHRQDICGVVQQILGETGLEAKFLELEITESTIMKDVESAAQTLRKLKSLGVQLSVDDFGTGYSSLSYLKRFATDTLKIDQSFIRDIMTDPDDALITRTIIGLAHNLGMKVVAEGVENEAQAAFLTRNGCDEMQGYYYSRPLPVDTYTALLEERRLLKPEVSFGRTLLLVDDEENILAALKRLLRRDGYQIFTATSARQGFELLAAHPVGVIVSDQRMPEMCGTEFLGKVKEIYPDTIRIVLSGYTDLQSITNAINQGSIYKFLTKPWEDDLLRENIRKAFEYFELGSEKGHMLVELDTLNTQLNDTRRQLEKLAVDKSTEALHNLNILQVEQEILERLPVGVVGVGEDGLIAMANNMANQLFAQGGSPLQGSLAAERLPGELLACLDGCCDNGKIECGLADGRRVEFWCYRMGTASQARGMVFVFKLM
ncbi:MAG: EAL domain-containing protein [Nitrosomonadales bacterium]|nr:EAL domain-containing protein [Nitrosomonadales bacterium]